MSGARETLWNDGGCGCLLVPLLLGIPVLWLLSLGGVQWAILGAGGLAIAGVLALNKQRMNAASLLRQRFASLGDLRGRSMNDITAAIGPAHTETRVLEQDRGTLVRWRVPQLFGSGALYQVSLVFVDDVFSRIEDEIVDDVYLQGAPVEGDGTH